MKERNKEGNYRNLKDGKTKSKGRLNSLTMEERVRKKERKKERNKERNRG
jgi:hypothetical protein